MPSCRCGPPVVGGRQPLHGLLRAEPVTEQREAVRAVTRVGERLGGDRPDVRLGPGDDGADTEELRLDGDAPLLRLEVARDDGVRRDESVSHR